MRKVITYGTFDLFHIGHLRLLERLRALGDHLTVFVSSDEFTAVKGKAAAIGYSERASIVAALRCVDDVYPECNWDQKISDVQKLGINVFGMGDDWVGRFDFLHPYCEVVYLPRTPGVSSTLLKEQISQAGRADLVEILRAEERAATKVGA
jgi:glycerol-3-phosphate cytidylyltransferase